MKEDLKNNKQEYLEIIDILNTHQISKLIYHEDESVELNENIIIIVYTGEENDDFNNGHYDLSETKSFELKNFEALTNEEKNKLKSFVDNRNSQFVDIYNKYDRDGKVKFYFYGLTYIAYNNNNFNIEKRECPLQE